MRATVILCARLYLAGSELALEALVPCGCVRRARSCMCGEALLRVWGAWLACL
jgi:hypothetical protein